MCRTSRVCVRMRAVKMRIRVCSEYVEGRATKRARGPRLRKLGIDRSTRKITTHTECFTCSRIYFDRPFDSCPHCGRTTARHYDSEDLNYFTQKSRLANRYIDAPNPDYQQLAVACKRATREFSRELPLAGGHIQADQTVS
jgi:hypothetical protein